MSKTKTEDLEDLEQKSVCTRTAGLFPADRPDLGDFEETLVVHDGAEKGLHVEISDIVTQPESWGAYLAAIAHAISGEIADWNDMSQEEAERLIRRSFFMQDLN